MYLLPVLLLLTPSLSASPSPPILASDADLSLIPHHMLFLRQVSDLQTFTGALGGIRASPITKSNDPKRPFQVESDTFDQFASAAQRSCDVQFKGCSDAANGAGGGGGNNQNQNQNQNRNQGQNQAQGQNPDQGPKGSKGAKDNGNNNNNNNNNNNRDNDNGGKGGKKGKKGKVKRQNNGITVNQCDEQKNQCNAAQSAATVKDFSSTIANTNIGPDPQFPDFDLICEG